MTFHEHSKQIVEEYLGTVAYVDDLIFSNKGEPRAKNLGRHEIREIGAKVLTLENDDSNKTERQLIPNIDPIAMTNAFFKKGIHCALLELAEDKGNIEAIKKTLKKSDVIILDWQMHHDLGKSTCELIEFILNEDKETTLSFRLLIVYTDQPVFNSLIKDDLIPIFEKLKVTFEKLSETEIQSGHTKIIVLNKPPIKIKEDDKVAGEDLPDRIVEELTKLTEGLVSNYALSAITAIRRNSHKLLGVYNKDMDSAFLAHRAMLPIPEDAVSLLKETIIDSINSIISYSNISQSCSYQKISDLLETYNIENKIIDLSTRKGNKIDITISSKDILDWQAKGYDVFFHEIVNSQLNHQLSDDEFRLFESRKLKSKAIECFSIKNPPIKGINEEFAILTHHKSNFKTSSYVPNLSLGVIVQKKSTGKYYMCIQQRCDSIRIPEDEVRNFLFLPLGEEGNFSIIIKTDENIYESKRINDKNCHHLTIEKFKPNYNGFVQADVNFNFTSVDGVEFTWVLELKDSHAQRIANKYASQLSRVGLDESEWLRRM